MIGSRGSCQVWRYLSIGFIQRWGSRVSATATSSFSRRKKTQSSTKTRPDIRRPQRPAGYTATTRRHLARSCARPLDSGFRIQGPSATAPAPAAVREVTTQDWDIPLVRRTGQQETFPVGQTRNDANRIHTASATGSLDSASTVARRRSTEPLTGGSKVNLATLRPGGGGRLLVVPGAGNRGHLHPTLAAAKSDLGPDQCGLVGRSRRWPGARPNP